jgi:drug/metabolite transporter (DMT)-like permease
MGVGNPATASRRVDQGPLLWCALGTLYIVWGSTYLAIRVLVETIPPLLGAGTRFLAAGAILAGVLVLRGGWARLRVSRAEALGGAGVSVLTLYAAFSLLFIGETEVPSGLAALLIASIPLWVVLLRLLARERVPRGTLAAVALGFAGVAVLVLPGQQSHGAPMLWMLVIVLAAVSEAVGSFSAKRVRLPADALVTTTLQMLFAGVLTVLTAVAVGELGQLDLGELSAESLIAFAYLVGPGSVLAYTAFVWLLQNAPVSTATTYAYVNPVVAILLGWLILSEEITASILGGAIAIVAAVAVVVSREAQAAAQGRPERSES